MADDLKEVSINETVKGETKFGLDQIGAPTPKWAKWVFRIYLYIASVTTVVITTDNEIPAQNAARIAKYLAFGTMAVHGASKLFGVKVDEDEFKSM